MKILNRQQLAQLDASTITQQQIRITDLVQRAANAFVRLFTQKIKKGTTVQVFCGPGNNGADGLAISLELLKKGYLVKVFLVGHKEYSPALRYYKERIEHVYNLAISNEEKDFLPLPEGIVVIDALFGTGLNRPLEGLTAQLIAHINGSSARVYSVDLPSGLIADNNTCNEAVIAADYTISFQLPKLAFMMGENFKYIGNWELADIGLSAEMLDNLATPYEYMESGMIRSKIKQRKKDGHKGDYGRALIIAGRHGMMGAGVLCAQACYRAGAGLVNAYIPAGGYLILQTAVPEAMVVTDPSQESITALPDIARYNAIAIGPGMSEGPATKDAFQNLLTSAKAPLVIDAGALNILSQNQELLEFLPKNTILTPHVVEFERIAGKQGNEFERLETARRIAVDRKIIIVLKGAHTAVVAPNGKVYFNSTGNPGMATGGSGDVLTGIITALLAQSYTPLDAAILGVYIHGYAGDIAAKNYSQPSMIASDIIAAISGFYKDFIT